MMVTRSPIRQNGHRLLQREGRVNASTLLPGEGRRWERWVLSLSLALLAAVYTFLALKLAGHRAFWSPDSGARFAMVRNWLERGHLIYLPYPQAAVDPGGHLHPLSYYLVHRPQGFCTIFPPLFPFLSGCVYRVLGFAGLALLPLLAGLGTVLATFATARRVGLRSRMALPLVMGLATPLIVYSVVFWDPAIQMLLAALAGYFTGCALQDERFWPAVAAGAVLGLGVWFQETFLALFLASVLATLPIVRHPYGRRLILGLVQGFAPVALLWMFFNQAIYGLPIGPHFLGPNNMTAPITSAGSSTPRRSPTDP